MTTLPITHMTLYKHGVGFFERRAAFSGEEIELSFRVEEMNDILKSLTAIDWGEGQVLGIDYATPQSVDERLAGCSIRLDDDRSLQDLLISLRGRRVQLSLDQDEDMSGTLVGLDGVGSREALATSLVSVLSDDTAQVQTVPLGRVQAVTILDERGANDLRFFLQTSLSQENFRQVRVRLSAGAHDLSVSYIAPAPTWRVSYRLVADPEAEEGPQALLMGWGIFDNQLEEDLQAISLALVAGMPISFVYDLYTPFTPDRPVVEEEARVAAAPVAFGGALMEREEGMLMADMAPPPAPAPMARARAKRAPGGRATGMKMDKALAASAPVSTSGESLGELFQYKIDTPVTVGRGHSAMVPIIGSRLRYTKDLMYNGQKMPTHPVATIRLKNESGLTLERGPVTVIENGEYVGEALLPFTATGSELVVPYAVELTAKVQEHTGSRREIYRLRVKDGYLLVEEWDVRWREYQLNNHGSQEVSVLIEHPRTRHYERYETAEPAEKTEDQWRFQVTAPPQGETTLKVQERRLVSRREELKQQSFVSLQRYFKLGLMDRRTHDQLTELLNLWQKVNEKQAELAQLEQARQKIYRSQEQIQKNMHALSNTGKEGALRTRYVDQLEASEGQLKSLAGQEVQLKADIEQLEAEIAAKLKGLK